LNAAALRPFESAPVEVQTRLLRGVAACAMLLCTWLFWFALRGVRWRSAAVIAFAFNPLVLLEIANGAHNDIYLLLAGLCAFVLAQRRQYELAALALGVAVATKFAYAPFVLPLAAYTLARSRSWLRSLATVAIFAGSIVALALPLSIRLSLVDVALDFNASHPPLYSYFLWRAFYHLGLHHSTQAQFALVFPLLTAACAAGIAWFALRGERRPWLELAMMISILLIPYKIEIWYAIMLALVLLIRRPWAPAAFLGIIAAGEVMERRIFFSFDRPYMVCIAVGITTAFGVWYLMHRATGKQLEMQAAEAVS
jgi:hypothetical protein